MTTLRAFSLSAFVSIAVTATALLTAPTLASALTMAQARVLAMKRVKGIVLNEVSARSGSGWRYILDIRQNRVIHRVGIDAASGKVVEDIAMRPSDPTRQGERR